MSRSERPFSSQGRVEMGVIWYFMAPSGEAKMLRIETIVSFHVKRSWVFDLAWGRMIRPRLPLRKALPWGGSEGESLVGSALLMPDPPSAQADPGRREPGGAVLTPLMNRQLSILAENYQGGTPTNGTRLL